MLTWLILNAHAAPKIGAIVRPEAVVDVAADRDGEDAAAVHTWIRAFASDELERGDSWFLEARVQHHTAFGDDVEAWWALGLGETGWDGRLGGPDSPVRLRIGALRERWGKLDLLPVIDVLNPTDARAGLLAPPGWQRLVVPMAVLQVGSDTVRAETIVIPFATADRLWMRDTDWSLVRQGMTEDLLLEMGTWDGETALVVGPLLDAAILNSRTADPSYRRGQDAALNQSNLPQGMVYDGDFAERFEVDGRGFDVAIMGGWLRTHFPQAELNAKVKELLIDERLPENDELTEVEAATLGGTPLDLAWPRTAMAGLEASTLVSDFQVRAEGGFWSHRVVRTPYGSATTSPQVGAGLGLDYVRGSTFQVTLEGRWLGLLDAPAQLVMAAENQITIAAGTRIAVAQERVQFTIGGAYDVSFNEILARPSVAWRLSDQWQLELGGVILEGFTTEAPDDTFDALTYQGGPASYWSQNDAVTLALTWIL